MDVATRNPNSYLLHLDDVAIMEFSSSFSEEITPRPSLNQYSHELFPHYQPVHHHRQQVLEPSNVFSPYFTTTSSEDGDTLFLHQNRNHHHIHYHQQQFNHFRNHRPQQRQRQRFNDIPYEQLLELQERIGNVNTGLSVENITTCLKTRTVTSGDGKDEEIFNETCIVCQDEYKDQDTIGTLKCGHEYHRDCIKEWLLLKNVCPICKRPAQ